MMYSLLVTILTCETNTMAPESNESICQSKSNRLQVTRGSHDKIYDKT